ncbi:DUF805 domain-containing protein [Roseitranquillus sediminis]|uniref:DUF805 domain-containing protein n=1 Tax=Roseitranquillus sediminis TaxID=2809051 RepID=UPI001D0C6480|nr:DUF805 domain-containing protein [Roseitranquillus sediminis]MBM9594807.1 DUF805 domain-containing protein [Roseitranquillus sediminis]
MRFAEAVRTCLRKYATFSGRATRSEYWWFVLFLILASAVAGVVDAALFGGDPTVADGAPEAGSGPVAGVFKLATLLPGIAAGWRRMHDTGRSGLHLVYPLIVMVGIATFAGATGAVGLESQAFQGVVGLVLVVALLVFVISPLLVLWWLTRPSQPGPNRFGPAPGEAL